MNVCRKHQQQSTSIWIFFFFFLVISFFNNLLLCRLIWFRSSSMITSFDWNQSYSIYQSIRKKREFFCRFWSSFLQITNYHRSSFACLVKITSSVQFFFSPNSYIQNDNISLIFFSTASVSKVCLKSSFESISKIIPSYPMCRLFDRFQSRCSLYPNEMFNPLQTNRFEAINFHNDKRTLSFEIERRNSAVWDD